MTSIRDHSFHLYLIADVAYNPWLLVGVSTYGHCGDDVIDALIDEGEVGQLSADVGM